MSASPTIEGRLESLEHELAALKRRLKPADANGNWLESIAGSQASEPDFDEVLQLGREARAADRDSTAGDRK